MDSPTRCKALLRLHCQQTDEEYTFDANGNRTMTGYSTGDNNQLTNDGTYSYEYDGEGNRTTRTNDTTYESTEYDWDYRNRLTTVTDKDDQGATTQVVEYTYDVFNRRIGRAVDTSSPFDMADAVIERHVYDDVFGITSFDHSNVVLDFVDADGEGSGTMDLERRYLYGDAVDQILAQENIDESTGSADRVYWHLTDHLGTVRDLAKNDGTLGEHYEYDTFGNIASGDTSVTRYLFTSREFDEDTELQYSRARWYDPAVGRWVREDPIGFSGGDTNLYAYARNKATTHVDPSGLFEIGGLTPGQWLWTGGVLMYEWHANAYRAVGAIATGEAGREMGERAVLLTQNESGEPFDGDAADYAGFAMNLAQEMSGANAVAEGAVGVDAAHFRELDAWERATRISAGTGQMAGTAAGGFYGASRLGVTVGTRPIQLRLDFRVRAPRTAEVYRLDPHCVQTLSPRGHRCRYVGCSRKSKAHRRANHAEIHGAFGRARMAPNDRKGDANPSGHAGRT